MPSYIITIIHTNGKKNESGLRYTDLTNIEEIQKVVREKLRQANKMDTLAYIQVVRSNLPATKPL
jgi:hypothetical protein